MAVFLSLTLKTDCIVHFKMKKSLADHKVFFSLLCVIYTHTENEFTLLTWCGLCNDYLLSPDPKLDSEFHD